MFYLGISNREPSLSRKATVLLAICLFAGLFSALNAASNNVEKAHSEGIVVNFMGGFYYQSIEQDPSTLEISVPTVNTGVDFVDSSLNSMFAAAKADIEGELDSLEITRDQDITVEFDDKNIIFRDENSKIFPISLQCSASDHNHQVTCDPDLPYRKLDMNLGSGNDKFAMLFDDKKRILPATSINLGEGNDEANMVTKKNIILDVTADDGDDVIDIGAKDNWRYKPHASGNDGNDRLTCFDSKCDFDGDDGDDVLIGDDRNDTLNGGNGRNIIEGHDGWDTITAGRDNDKIKGGDDRDKIEAGDGINNVQGGQGTDKIIGGKDIDWLYGGDGWDHIEGGGSTDIIEGGDGSDYIDGGSGSDRLYGGTGPLVEDAGIDTIKGGGDGDEIWVNDEHAGIPDKVDCGGAHDTVHLNPLDSRKDCELILDTGAQPIGW